MRGRRVGDGTCLFLWRRRCHLRCRCWSLQGCCSNFGKDLETNDDRDEGEVGEEEKFKGQLFHDDREESRDRNKWLLPVS